MLIPDEMCIDDFAETAAAVAFFLREDAGFLTGEMLSVSGGIRPHL